MLNLTVWVGLAATVWIGFHIITRKFFFDNPAYNLQQVEVSLDGLMTKEEALSLTRIELGTNIFRVNLGAAERALRQIEQVKTVTIERDWPDRITITLVKRHPVAWLARAGDGPFNADRAWLLDAQGDMMKPYRVDPDYWRLPVIYAPDPSLLRGGDTLARFDLEAALALLAEHADRPDSRLDLRSIDISKGYAFVATDARNARITFGPGNPADQLDRLELLLESCEATGRQLESVNLIPKKYTPVRFVMASANRADVEEPNPEAER